MTTISSSIRYMGNKVRPRGHRYWTRRMNDAVVVMDDHRMVAHCSLFKVTLGHEVSLRWRSAVSSVIQSFPQTLLSTGVHTRYGLGEPTQHRRFFMSVGFVWRKSVVGGERVGLHRGGAVQTRRLLHVARALSPVICARLLAVSLRLDIVDGVRDEIWYLL